MKPLSSFALLAASCVWSAPSFAQTPAPADLWQGAQAWLAGAAVSVSASRCAAPRALPRVRRAGNLVVESPPRAKPERWLRLRTHRSPPDRHHLSYWEGPEVPSFVPLTIGALELELLDPIPGGYLALYRSHGSALGANDSYEARLFACNGQALATLALNPLFSRRDQLEVQDIRYADGTLYLNEACQSYSSQAGGRCSALLAVDVRSGRRLWTTGPLVSNSVIQVLPTTIIAGYGFTAEKDWVRVVRRGDGKVLDRQAMPSSHFAIEARGSVLDVEVGGSWASYRMDGFGGATPKLVPLGTRPGPTSTPSAAPSAASLPAYPALPALPAWPALPQWPAPSTAKAPGPMWTAPWVAKR